jgi:hypothetical protein
MEDAEKEDECGLCSKYLKRRKNGSCRLRKSIQNLGGSFKELSLAGLAKLCWLRYS